MNWKTKWNINYLDKLSAWNTAIMFWLVLLITTLICWKKIQKQVHCTAGPTFAETHCKVVSIGQFCKYSSRRCSFELVK